MPDALAEFKELADRMMWRSIQTAPQDRFIILWCPEDGSRWWASWQSGEWHGVDEFGLTRRGHSLGDTNYVSGWFVAGWLPIPDGPPKTEA